MTLKTKNKYIYNYDNKTTQGHANTYCKINFNF